MCLRMREEITFSTSLDSKDKFETGLWFLNTCGSRPGFLINHKKYIINTYKHSHTIAYRLHSMFARI